MAIKEIRDTGVANLVTASTATADGQWFRITAVGTRDELMTDTEFRDFHASATGAVLENAADGYRVAAAALGSGLTGGGAITIDIADGGVTYAKIQDTSAAERLIGRGAGTAGDVQEISVGSGLGFTGQVLDVADAGVTYAKIQDVTVGSVVLGRGDSGAGDVQQLTLGSGLDITGTTLDVAVDGVTYAMIQDTAAAERILGRGAGVAGEVEELSLGSTLDMALTTLDVADGGITYAKIQDTAGSSVLVGRGDSGPGTVQEISVGGGLGVTGTALGVSTGGITYAMVQDVSAADRLLGRGATGPGDVQELSLGSTLDITTTTLDVVDGGITYAKIQDTAAAERILGRGAGVAGDVQELTIGGGLGFTGTTLEVPDNAITFAKQANLTTNQTLVGRGTAGAGDPEEISLGTTLAITTGTLDIPDGGVSYAKVQDVTAASRLLGRGDSGSGDVQEITLGSGLTMTGTVLDATAGGGLPVSDSTSIVKGSVDATKQLRFEVDGNTTGIVGVVSSAFTTAKTLNLPDANDTLVARATADTLTNKTINTASNTITINEADISDLQAYLVNVADDATPQLGADLDGQGNNLNNMGVVFLTEQAAADADVVGKGQVWVQTATPNLLMFTNDAGTDYQIATLTGTETLTNKSISLATNTVTTTMAQLDTAVSDGNVAYAGGAFHDGFSDFVADEHVAHTSVTVTIAGDANEITVAEGAQDISTSRTFNVGIADNPTLPGTGAMIVPSGTTAQEPAGTNGQVRYDTTTDKFRIYQGGAWRDLTASSGANQQYLYHVRNNTVLTDYVDGYTTSADFGTRLNDAIVALAAGDLLLVGPGEYQYDGFDVTANDVRLIFEGATIVPNGNYDKIMFVSGDDVVIEGLRIDAGGAANTGDGIGLQIGNANTPKRCIIRDCRVDGTRGTGSTDGRALKIFGDDCQVFNFITYDPGYCGISIANADRCVIDGAYIANPLNRSLNLESTQTIDFLTVRNVTTVADQASREAQFNFNNTAIVDSLTIENCNITQLVNYNSANRHQCVKVQNVNHLSVTGCNFRNAANDGSGNGEGFAFDSVIPSINFRDCHFADGFSFGGPSAGVYYRHPHVLIESCSFGNDRCETGAMLFELQSDNFVCRNSRFNLNTNASTSVFTVDADRVATDRLEFTNNVVTGNNTSNLEVFGGASLELMGDGVVVYGNQLSNDGTGSIVYSADTPTNAICNANIAGTHSQFSPLIYANGNLGAAPTIDWRNGSHQSGVVDQAATVTFTAPVNPGRLQLLLNDTTGYTVTWPGALKGPRPYHRIGNTLIDIYYDGTDYWVLDVSGRRVNQTVIASDGDTTPSVEGADILKTANTTATTVTDFDDFHTYQKLTVIVDANTTIQHGAGVIELDNSVNFAPASGGTLNLVDDEGTWKEIGRATF